MQESHTRHAPSLLRRFRLPIIVVAVLVLAYLCFGAVLTRTVGLYMAQWSSDRYAFYLESGEALYGRVAGVSLGSIVLKDAYSFQQVSVGETSTSNLIAATDNPLTRPDNWMVLSRRHVVFYERIGSEASILKVIGRTR